MREIQNVCQLVKLIEIMRGVFSQCQKNLDANGVSGLYAYSKYLDSNINIEFPTRHLVLHHHKLDLDRLENLLQQEGEPDKTLLLSICESLHFHHTYIMIILRLEHEVPSNEIFREVENFFTLAKKRMTERGDKIPVDPRHLFAFAIHNPGSIASEEFVHRMQYIHPSLLNVDSKALRIRVLMNLYHHCTAFLNVKDYSAIVSAYSLTSAAQKLIEQVEKKLGEEATSNLREKHAHWRLIHDSKGILNKLFLFRKVIKDEADFNDYIRIFEKIGCALERIKAQNNHYFFCFTHASLNSKFNPTQNKEMLEQDLRQAASDGDTEKLIQLLNEHPYLNINAKGKTSQRTALHWAIDKDHTETVLALLGRGADPFIRGENDRDCPFYYALSKMGEMNHIMQSYLKDIKVIDGKEKFDDIIQKLKSDAEQATASRPGIK